MAPARISTGRTASELNAETKVSAPETIGETPNPTCNISGSMNGTPL